MAKTGLNIGLNSYDDLFASAEERNSEMAKPVSISELKPFEEQPFKVLIDESMDELVESVKEYGVITPVIARPHPDGGYEIVSGHRRVKACEIAGIEEIPVIVKDLDDDSATILLVDSNLQRENILPSEKAKAYQMKMDAMRRKAGRPSKENGDQIGHNFSGQKSVEVIADNSPDSRNQIQRYIRLNELIDPLIEMVDEGKLAMNAAVELSYLGSKEQSDVVKAIAAEEAAPKIAQAKKIRRFSSEGKLNDGVIEAIMQEQKPEKVQVTFKEDRLRKYFPKNYSVKQIEDILVKLMEKWARQRAEPER